ncbi:MAG: hypothetical protein ABGZ17_30940, partial [Planctomycetaceae bacterium]
RTHIAVPGRADHGFQFPGGSVAEIGSDMAQILELTGDGARRGWRPPDKPVYRRNFSDGMRDVAGSPKSVDDCGSRGGGSPERSGLRFVSAVALW